MSHEKLSELCSIYALGALDGEELREFEAHLKTGCTLCRQQIWEYGETARVLRSAKNHSSHRLKSESGGSSVRL